MRNLKKKNKFELSRSDCSINYNAFFVKAYHESDVSNCIPLAFSVTMINRLL